MVRMQVSKYIKKKSVIRLITSVIKDSSFIQEHRSKFPKKLQKMQIFWQVNKFICVKWFHAVICTTIFIALNMYRNNYRYYSAHCRFHRSTNFKLRYQHEQDVAEIIENNKTLSKITFLINIIQVIRKSKICQIKISKYNILYLQFIRNKYEQSKKHNKVNRYIHILV